MLTAATRCALALLAACALPAQASAEPVSIEPTSVEIPAEPGARHRQVLRIENSGGDAPLSLTLAMVDWSIAKSGALALAPSGSADRSAAAWARVTPGFLSLEPGEAGHVIVDVIVPARPEKAGNHRAALLASQVAPGPDGIMQRTEAASLFYLTVDPAVSDPVITGARLAGPPGQRRLDIDLANSGNAHARLEGTVRIEGSTGTPVSLPVSNLVVLEASQRTFSLPVEADLPVGARVTISFDNLFAPQSETGIAPVRSWSAPLDGLSG